MCERADDASCIDPNWADWPMPNSAVDSPPAPNLQSYTDNHDGTVTDNVTGLMWQQTASTSYFTWGSASTSGTAQNHCATLSLAGHSDWRLPSLIELESIVDFSAQGPAINGTYFPNMPPDGLFWTATPVVGVAGYQWAVSFLDGTNPYTGGGSPGGDYALCVR